MTRQEAEELLPWFINGTLAEAEARAVQAFIDSGEISQREIEEVKLFSDSIQAQVADEPEFNPAILNGVMARLDSVEQEVAEAPLIVAEPQAREGFIARMLGKLEWAMMPPLAKVAVAGQFALVVALSAALLTTADRAGDSEFVTVSGGTAGQSAADVQILFAPDTPESEIRTLLLYVEGTIVAGPSSQGVYQIALPDEANVADVTEALAASAITQLVQPAPKDS